MDNLQIAEYKGIRVLTTNQLAECYGTIGTVISRNFNRNKEKYIEGKHYICLNDKDKREFLNRGQFDSGCKTANHEIDDNLIHARNVYLWTEKGALLHAKSLNTNKAWEVYENLVDFYFRAKEKNIEQNHQRTIEDILKEQYENGCQFIQEPEQLAFDGNCKMIVSNPYILAMTTLIPVDGSRELVMGCIEKLVPGLLADKKCKNTVTVDMPIKRATSIHEQIMKKHSNVTRIMSGRYIVKIDCGKLENEIIKSGMPMYEIAEKTGINIVTLKSWRRGANSPTMGRLEKLCDTLNVPHTYFDAKEDKA